MIEVLLNDYSIYGHIVAQVFLGLNSSLVSAVHKGIFAVLLDFFFFLLLFNHPLHIHIICSLDRRWYTVCYSLPRQFSLSDNFFGETANDLGRLLGDQVESDKLAVARCQDLNPLLVVLN